ncbi:hypothetical protein SLEP1_g31733 [Rubroshorea leprosula]|uniref:Uncharacterized protein n=1 Tax=Rubroshorea leprosula TaxID=152421 RepID=A0AAV5KAS4_9ROSI|nr:hypothetical protein SLEP1_g31733 [Rubroshorea leprosula]
MRSNKAASMVERKMQQHVSGNMRELENNFSSPPG